LKNERNLLQVLNTHPYQNMVGVLFSSSRAGLPFVSRPRRTARLFYKPISWCLILGFFSWVALSLSAHALTFTDIGANLTGVDGASVAWGDYDNDGQLDLLVSGSGTSIIYHNSNGVFTVGAFLTGISYGQAVWGDYNNDGRLDVMQDGFGSGGQTWQIYRNAGSNIFTPVSFPVPGFGNMTTPSSRFISCAWGDYDNDGKLDPLFVAWPYSTLYHNNGNDSFSDSGISVPAPGASDTAWGDYNNDGYLDFVVNGGGGSGLTALYQNLGNSTLVPATNVLTGVYAGSAAWADFNNDGNLDLAVTGQNNNQGVYISMLFVGDGHGGFTNTPTSFDGTVLGSVAWGDFDGDGRPDLVVSSSAGTGTTKVFHNNGNGTLTDTGVSLPGCSDGAVAAGDFNNDGKLDIAIVGAGVAKIFRNDTLLFPNTLPNPPQFFTATATTNTMLLSWSAANDPNQSGGLSYNLRVGTSPVGVDVVSPMADPATGFRRIPALGNAGPGLSKPLKHLHPGTYYWAVQAIDHNFAGSQFTAEASFTISAPVFSTQPASITNAPGTTADFQVTTTGTSPMTFQWWLNGLPLADNGRIAGAITPHLSLTNVQATDAGNYTVVAMNVAGSATSSVAVLTVTAPPVVTTQPTNVTVSAGAATTFSVAVAGTGPFLYQWQFKGTNVDAGTNATLLLTNIQLSQAGAYSVVVSNNYGGVASSNAVLTVIPMTIAVQPSSQSVVGGASASFSASVSGVGPFGYQWQFAGTNIPGATSSTLTLNNAQVSQSGVYDVIVTNAYGSATSSNALLAVTPWAAVQPTKEITAPGSTVTFTALQGGLDASTTYQWLFMGTNLPGATTNPLVLTNAQAGQAGSYSVIVSNAYGMAASSNATLSLKEIVAWGDNTYGQTNPPPILTNVISIAAGSQHVVALNADHTLVAWGDNSAGQTNIPADLSNVVSIASSAMAATTAALKSDGTAVLWGDNSRGQTNVPIGTTNLLSLAVGGGHVVAVKSDHTVTAWGYNVSGQASPPPGLSNVVAVSAGSAYSLALRNNGTVVGWGFSANGEQNFPAGLSNVIAISAGAFHGLALRQNGSVLAWGNNSYGQASVPANLSNVVAISAGFYTSMALKADGSVVAWGNNSNGQSTVPFGLTNAICIAGGSPFSAALLNNGAPVITAQPFSQQPYTGQPIVIHAAAGGAGTLGYQWQFNGTNIEGATNLALTVPNAQAVNAGDYRVIVANAFGSVTSAPVTLTVPVSPPIIFQQPTNIWSLLFSNAAFSLNAGGSLPLFFQWQFNGINIEGATNAALTLTNLQVAHEGLYGVVVSNAYGSVISSNAFLSVSRVVGWGSATNLPPGLTNVVAINGFPAALKGDGRIVTWTAAGLHLVAGVSNGIVAIAPSMSSTCTALSSNGNVSLWNSGTGFPLTSSGSSNVVALGGDNYADLELKFNGRLAGTATNGMSPSLLASMTNVVAVSQGIQYSMALKSDGSVAVWGNTSFGQQNIPAGLSNVIGIAAGGGHCLALKDDGTVAAWGGRFGSATNVPPGLAGVVAIAGGSDHSLALRRDGTVVAWGLGNSGQTNVPAGLSNVVMIAAGATCSLALVGNAPPLTQAAMVKPGTGADSFNLTVPTQSGRVYALEFKSNLNDTIWIPLPLALGTGRNLMLVDPTATNSQRFYRLRAW
jgi:alpha-tubulin suppressor-like RCC1 family protein